MGCDTSCNYGSCGNNRAIPNFYSRKNYTVGPYPHIFTHYDRTTYAFLLGHENSSVGTVIVVNESRAASHQAMISDR